MDEHKIDDLLGNIGSEHLTLPSGLVEDTFKQICVESERQSNPLPYLVVTVVFINMLTSIFIGGLIFLLSPLTMVDWLIVGIVFSTFNGMFYGLTYAFRDQIRHTLEAYH